MRRASIAVAGLAAGLLAACASTAMAPTPDMQRMADDMEAAQARQQEAAREAVATYHRVNEIWLGATAVKRDAPELPVFSRPVSYSVLYDVTLHDIAGYVSESYGLPVSITDDAIEAAGQVPSPRALGLDGMPPLKGLTPQLRLPENMPESTSTGMGMGAGGRYNGGGRFRVAYEGDLRGFLDTVAAKTTTSWRHRGGGIEFFAVDTQVFRVDVLPAPSAVQAEVSSRSMGGGSNGGMSGSGMGGMSGGMSGGGIGGAGGENGTQIGGSASTSSQIEIDPFTSIVEAVESMLSNQGKVTATAPLGQIVVTDRPAILARVGEYIEQANTIATRQVALEVRVFAVESNRSSGHSISWDMVWSSLGSRAGVDLIGGGPSTGGPSMGVTILDSDSPFSGSRLFLDALAEQANVKQLTSATAITLSGRPVPFQVTEEIGYLESSQVSLVPDVGMQTTINPGRTTSGFTMTLLPILSANNDVLMQATISLRSLRELRRLGSDQQGNTYETPLTDLRQVMQHMNLRSGQTAIMTGFEQETLRSNSTGVGSPRFRLLGGSKLDEERSTSLVIMITPKVVL